jgi:DNA repair protein RadD
METQTDCLSQSMVAENTGSRYILRDYQVDAVESAVRFLENKNAKKPVLIIMPTGAGKSLIIASIAERIDAPLIVFQPTKEILEQNFNKMMDYGIMGVTIYSASMNRKEIGNITLATIGSVYKKPEDFKHFKYIIMDEAHLCNAKGGMYKQFFEVVGEKIIGLTATPYRLSHDGFGGSILKFLTRTNPRVFGKVIHVTQTETLSRLGYFCKTEYYQIKGFNRSEIQLNSTGADYLETSEKAYYSKYEFNKSVLDVVRRLLKVGKTKILVFTKFVEESQTLANELGDCASMVSGEMNPKDRDRIIRDFRSGKIKVVANVGVLTLGFDYPELEVVVIARPTRSLTLDYQMMGRCVRPHPQKKSAWIIDMCGNYEIFGKMEDMRLVEFNDNLWYVMSNGQKLTNVYLNEIMKD